MAIIENSNLKTDLASCEKADVSQGSCHDSTEDLNQHFLGIDCGNLCTKVVWLNAFGHIQAYDYHFHQGNPRHRLAQALQGMALAPRISVALTGAGASSLQAVFTELLVIDSIRATIHAIYNKYPTIRNIIDIGGSSLTLIRCDEHGRFRSFRTNSNCAAGTGSFLDEQAIRLGLDYQNIQNAPHLENPPTVASRCAVFARSDLIHLQQIGTSKQDMWSGLCRGMAQTVLQTLSKGSSLIQPTAIIGGVSFNPEVMYWLKETLSCPVIIPEHAPFVSALGVGHIIRKPIANIEPIDSQRWCESLWESTSESGQSLVTSQPISQKPKSNPSSLLLDPFLSSEVRPLRLYHSKFPDPSLTTAKQDKFGNDIFCRSLNSSTITVGYLGVDVGSTSTKLCCIDSEGQVLVDIYRKTNGNPIAATQSIFDALYKWQCMYAPNLMINSCGTTGSGRQLIGTLVGADQIVNEISAHAAGARSFDPHVETIFEIGGQDSKYIYLRDGFPIDANMNYACAAGTGSFVEEQARKLGIALDQVGDLVMGQIPPATSDRCTVFMEQDVNKLLREGYSPAQVLAGVLRSVVLNYLNKVVGRRPISENKIVFQGATARNKALVAAFENVLNREIVVSPFSHVMGAYGVALYARDYNIRSQKPSQFRGLDFSTQQLHIERRTCTLCSNRCVIHHAQVGQENTTDSWGYLCGRDPQDKARRFSKGFQLFQTRQRLLSGLNKAPLSVTTSLKKKIAYSVSIPSMLANHSLLPLWRGFLETLGFRIQIHSPSPEKIRKAGIALTKAEFCFPIKIAHGHIYHALQEHDVDFVFLPHMVAQPMTDFQSNSYLCPYVQAMPTIIDTALQQAGCDTTRLLMPIVDRRQSREKQIAILTHYLRKYFALDEKAIAQAWDNGNICQTEFENQWELQVRSTLTPQSQKRCSVKALPKIVIAGRPYNVNDRGLNLDLPKKIAQKGYKVIPLDGLPFIPNDLDRVYRNVYWTYAQRILYALQYIRARDDLFVIYLTNFNCGPDSFLLSYAEKIMGSKPFLSLEIDEHAADTGYLTRIEAFLDVIRVWQSQSGSFTHANIIHSNSEDFQRRRIWIPPMHEVGSKLFAAAFRGFGFDALAMPPETYSDLNKGQQLCRGCECLPMRLTIGSFVNQIEQDPETKHALFMPTTHGPCRFGQYVTLHRQILHDLGFKNIPLLSPSADNTYAGLPQSLRRKIWQAMLAADLLYKMALKTRPYEFHSGDSDQLLEIWTLRLSEALEKRSDVKAFIAEAASAFQRIPIRREIKPIVGVVGEIYVRNNAFANENLLRTIEQAGGEAWPTPLSEWILFSAHEDTRRFLSLPQTLRETWQHGKRLVKSRFLQNEETAFYKAAGTFLANRHEPPILQIVRAGFKYLPIHVGGEAILSIGRTVAFAKQGAVMVINTSPFGCMAGNISASLFADLENKLELPILNLFYDSSGDENRKVEVFLHNLSSAPEIQHSEFGTRTKITGVEQRLDNTNSDSSVY